jgi:hypothetical protein
MRFFLTFLLAALLSLNAAYAAVADVCDTLEHTQGKAAYFGHHSHEHGDDHAHDAPSADPDQPGQLSAASDHHHAHVHPVFSTLPPDAIGVMPLGGRSPYVALDRRDFVSAPHIRLDRPPRGALA